MNETKRTNRWEETICPEAENCRLARDRDRFYRVCAKYNPQAECPQYKAKIEFDVERRCE
jgi:hypothetical protein